ncbi:MAG TPA: isoaspartyl peptidase/L-asparaginase [Longimicrobiales bacterium]|nr:isoaspartyl peptidase/L-asparaginase [Longimicrobiales bacterium]
MRASRTPGHFIAPAALGVCLLAGAAACAPQATVGGRSGEAMQASGGVGLVIHGGAGTIRRSDMTPEQDAEYRAKLNEALDAGYAVLERNGSAMDAVVAAVNVMEDSPLFNAGKGAVFTAAGTNEMDASIMDGRTESSGAVAGVKRIRNPIDLARMVLERSPHVMLVGDGAEAFAEEQGVALVDPGYFFTQRRWDALQKILEEEERARGRGAAREPTEAEKHGTVGAVALDRDGNLAAATSTGGMTAKRWGRVGDSPIIGAGTYASNQSCAVSATGHGEYFIQQVVAHDICARVKYLGESVEEAARVVVMEKLPAIGATGGIIAMDPRGNIATPFNTEGMYRGWVGADGRRVVRIYREE